MDTYVHTQFQWNKKQIYIYSVRMLLIEGLFFYRLLKWEKLELQYQRFGWCLSTKQLLVARLPLELLILHLDGKYYDWNFLLEMWGNRKPKLGFMTCKEQKKKINNNKDPCTHMNTKFCMIHPDLWLHQQSFWGFNMSSTTGVSKFIYIYLHYPITWLHVCGKPQ